MWHPSVVLIDYVCVDNATVFLFGTHAGKLNSVVSRKSLHREFLDGIGGMLAAFAGRQRGGGLARVSDVNGDYYRFRGWWGGEYFFFSVSQSKCEQLVVV